MKRAERSKDHLMARLCYYKKEKRLQGFLQFKATQKFKKMKTAVRKLQLGLQPNDEQLQLIKQVRLEVTSKTL